MRNIHLPPRRVASGQQPYARIAAALVIMPLLCTITAIPAEAQLLRVLHSFSTAIGPNGYIDGWNPNRDPLVLDSNGNLYGTTISGGPGLTTTGNLENAGTAFKLDAFGNNYTLFYVFKGYDHLDGSSPNGVVMDLQGNLYGTTSFGGSNGGQPYNGGTVFKLDTAGKETWLYTFVNPDFPPAAAADPRGSLLLKGRNLYGIASAFLPATDGNDYSPVFQIGTAGAPFNVLFDANGDGLLLGGALPGLAMDAIGNLYGTLSGGGGPGAVFKEGAILYRFTGATSGVLGAKNDGAFPNGNLIIDKPGNLYGTTEGGGDYFLGTVFMVDAAGNEMVLYSFTGSLAGGADGSTPQNGVTMDSAGNLYGTTMVGGAFNGGTIFKLDSSLHESVLCSFHGVGVGGPVGVLIMDPAANLYGTTPANGANGGTVFKLIPAPASQISVTTSGWAHSRVNASFPWILTVEITNDSGKPINGPFEISFTGLPANVTVGNATGVNGCDGSPYVTAAFSVLQPGQTGIVSNIAFSSEASFTAQVYSESIK